MLSKTKHGKRILKNYFCSKLFMFYRFFKLILDKNLKDNKSRSLK